MKTTSTHHFGSVCRLLSIGAVAAIAFAVAPQANAEHTGSVPQYPVGVTMGTPTGSLPPKAGIYVLWKPSYSDGYSLNANGNRTGVRSTSWASNAQVMWVPGIKVLGANYAAFIRNIGQVNITLRTPTGMMLSNAGKPDTDIVPINLSWKVADHLFFDAELGIYIKDGSYANVPGRINIGQNAWTYEPNFSLSWISKNWIFSGHAIFDINGWNHKAGWINGNQVAYRNGTTFDLDYTIFRRSGHWDYGVVGYYLTQISNDHGPEQLNAGKPKQFAAGVGAKYNFGPVSLIGTYTQDFYARNVSKKHMLMVQLSFKAF